MTCPNCGAEVAENRRFCGKCGTSLAPALPDPPEPSSVHPFGAPPTAWGSASSYAPPQPPPPSGPPTTDANPFAPPDLNAPPGYAAPPGYPPPGYASPPPGYASPPPGYGGPPPGYGGPPPDYPPGAWPGSAPPYPYGQQTNGLAVASLVLGLLGWTLCGVGSVVAVVLGFVARDQIKRSWGRQAGEGMATAGIILGFIGAAFWLVVLILGIVSAGSTT